MTARHFALPGIAMLLSLCFSLTFIGGRASAACTALPTDRGTVTNTVNIPADGTYRVWSRIKTADSTKNSFLMQMDQTNCNVNVGGSSVTANTWTWVDYTGGTSTAKNDMTLTAGSHTLTMAGNADAVEVDRVIFTQDTTCVPTGTGDNCANPPDTTPPIVAITAPTTGATISTTTLATASASDDVGVTKVEFYIDGSLKTTDTSAPYNLTIDPAAYAVGAHTISAIAYDAAGNTTTSGIVNFTIPDTTPPILSGITVSSISQTTATIGWITNEASDSQIEYGTSASYGSSSTINSTKVTTHSVGLSSLSANTLYHYRVKSRDAAGNLQSSADATFTTLPQAGDTTKPTVSMSSPSSGTVTGTVSVTATAADNVGVAGVQFKIGGANLGSEVTSAPYTYSWSTLSVANGPYVIIAVARDAAGNTQTTSNLSVTVNNSAPIVFLPEDINRSGHVDLSDFSILAANFNKSVAASSNPRADINGDGYINLSDFSRLASKFGQ